jgi:hypothetical protein
MLLRGPKNTIKSNLAFTVLFCPIHRFLRLYERALFEGGSDSRVQSSVELSCGVFVPLIPSTSDIHNPRYSFRLRRSLFSATLLTSLCTVNALHFGAN